mgnify:FL=1|tara:strand:- start:181 stop:798 length:618 start_codon:yes stop_codon:yes gene_type:complete
MFKRFKAIAVTSSLLLTPLFSTSSIAEEKEKFKGFYMMTGIGLTNTTDIDLSVGGSIVFDKGALWDIGAGYDFGNIRAEISYDETTENVDTVQGNQAGTQVKTRSVFATAYYDFRSDRKWQPYLGIGIGNSEIEATTAYVGNITLSAGDTNITSAIVKAGVSYSFENSDIFLERSGQGFDDFTIGSFTYTGVAVGSWTLGFRQRF